MERRSRRNGYRGMGLHLHARRHFSILTASNKVFIMQQFEFTRALKEPRSKYGMAEDGEPYAHVQAPRLGR